VLVNRVPDESELTDTSSDWQLLLNSPYLTDNVNNENSFVQ
jgi:hypothetical protein